MFPCTLEHAPLLGALQRALHGDTPPEGDWCADVSEAHEKQRDEEDDAENVEVEVEASDLTTHAALSNQTRVLLVQILSTKQCVMIGSGEKYEPSPTIGQ